MQFAFLINRSQYWPEIYWKSKVCRAMTWNVWFLIYLNVCFVTTRFKQFITAARGLTILGDLKAGNPAKRFSGEIVLGLLTRKKEDIPWVFTLIQPIPEKKKMNFPLLTVKSRFLARTNKRFILTGNVGRIYTIIIIVSVIVIFIVIFIAWSLSLSITMSLSLSSLLILLLFTNA